MDSTAQCEIIVPCDRNRNGWLLRNSKNATNSATDTAPHSACDQNCNQQWQQHNAHNHIVSLHRIVLHRTCTVPNTNTATSRTMPAMSPFHPSSHCMSAVSSRQSLEINVPAPKPTRAPNENQQSVPRACRAAPAECDNHLPLAHRALPGTFSAHCSLRSRVLVSSTAACP